MKSLIAATLFLVIFTLAACDPETPDDEFTADDIAPASTAFQEDVDVCYQIFPISYADSTSDGDGDLMGIVENVEYLSEDLGVDCVWLNPINPSPSYHKYNVRDYYDIDETFGDMDDFETFAETMEEHDIKIVKDLVINHTDFGHIWFRRSREDEGDMRDWYSWRDEPGHNWHEYNGEYYYGSFWDQMPELNFDNPDVRERVYHIAEYWLERGVDGFRIDAARHIYDDHQYPDDVDTTQENVDFFREFNAEIKNIDEDAFIVGEIWSESERYVSQYYEGMDSAFNFKFADEIVGAISNDRDNGAIEGLIDSRNAYEEVREDYIDSVFLSNHDQRRIMNAFQYNEDRAKLAAHVLMTMPGISWIYYGEEIGMSGSGSDPEKRQPFVWETDSPYHAEGVMDGHHDSIAGWDDHNQDLPGAYEQLEDEDSLLNTYIELIELKQTRDVLGNTSSISALETDSNAFMAYERGGGDDRYLVVHNLNAQERTTPFQADSYDIVYTSHDAEIEEDITMQGRSTVILDVEGDASLIE